MKTLVVGATGLVGMEVCRQLHGAGRPFRALVRSTAEASKRAEIERLGAELAEADLKAPATLGSACAGVRSVISTASSSFSRQEGDSIRTVDEQGQLALVDAARSAGVDHFVFISFRDNPRIQYPLTAAKRTVERHLKASGMAYTILQASYFMEVWLSPMVGFDYAGGKVRIYGDGNRQISWISCKDVARVAAAALDQAVDRADGSGGGVLHDDPRPPRHRALVALQEDHPGPLAGDDPAPGDGRPAAVARRSRAWPDSPSACPAAR